jgi:uncharacterized delta-60 repeat protein
MRNRNISSVSILRFSIFTQLLALKCLHIYFKKLFYLNVLFLIASISILHAAAGNLDETFGQNGTGIVTSTIGRENNLTFIVNQLDNSIIGVGKVKVITEASGICRYTSNGMLDTSFNKIGYTQFSASPVTVLTSAAIQSDNKTIVGGYVIPTNTSQFTLARYTTTGTLDSTFGNGGYITTSIPGGCSIESVIIQPDGKIIAGGVGGDGTPSFTLARYNTDGSLDTTFDNGGLIQAKPGYVSSIKALALQPDGKIIAAGFAWNLSTNVFAIARFNPNGILDETFGINGIVTTLIGGSCQAQTVALQEDGKIIVGGFTSNDNNLHCAFALARYDTAGTLDSSFNGTGTIITQLNYSSQIHSIAIQSDGKIIAGGYDFGAVNTTFALARYLTNGILDSTFGSNGITLTPIGTNAQINSLIIQSDNKIVAAGISDTSAALARYYA